MKSYKEYPKVSIGASDVAALTLTGCMGKAGVSARILDFGGDSGYEAYVVDDKAIIGGHYKPRFEFDHWLKIYDDEGLAAKFEGRKITVYRAADYGCVIKIEN